MSEFCSSSDQQQLLTALGQLACSDESIPDRDDYHLPFLEPPAAPSTSPVPWAADLTLQPEMGSWKQEFSFDVTNSALLVNSLPQRPRSAPPPVLQPLLGSPPSPLMLTSQHPLHHSPQQSSKSSPARSPVKGSSILMATHFVTNPFRPSCVINMATVRPRTPKKVRFSGQPPVHGYQSDSSSGRDYSSVRRHSNALDALALASLHRNKKKNVIKKSKLAFIGTKYCDEKREYVMGDVSKAVADVSSKCFNNRQNKVSKNIEHSIANDERTISKFQNPVEKYLKNGTSFLCKSIFSLGNPSELENFSQLALGSNMNTNSKLNNTDDEKNRYLLNGCCLKIESLLTKPNFLKHRSTLTSEASSSSCSIRASSSCRFNKSRRLLYKMRQRRKQLAESDLPNLTLLSLAEPSSSGSSLAQPRTCSQEARDEQHFEDTSLEELAAYIDDYLYFPKKMSFMAEMMYT